MSFDDDAKYGEWCQENIIKPQFYAKVWINCRIESSDMLKDNEIARILDIFASTDKLIIDHGGVLYALGQRVQRAEFAHYKSFTIRDKRYHSIDSEKIKKEDEDGSYYKSEFHKLTKAIQQGSIHSCYMAHCYMDGEDEFDTNNILHGMIVKTDGLFNFMAKYPKKVKQSKTEKDGNKRQTFKYVLFKHIKRLAPEIIIAEYENGEIITPKLQKSKQKGLFNGF